jgi:hypothetical protein
MPSKTLRPFLLIQTKPSLTIPYSFIILSDELYKKIPEV